MISVYTLTLAFSKIFCGWLYDKLGLKITVIICLVCGMVNVSALLIMGDSLFGKIIAIISALLFALSLPLETVMLPIYAGDMCGLKSYNVVLGIFVSTAYVGMAVAPPVMNLFYDLLGNYNLGLISFLILYVIITIVFIVSKNLSEKHKKQLERM